MQHFWVYRVQGFKVVKPRRKQDDLASSSTPPVAKAGIESSDSPCSRGFRVLGFWGFGVLGFWGFGVLGFWGFGVLGFWGSGVLGFWGFGVRGLGV